MSLQTHRKTDDRANNLPHPQGPNGGCHHNNSNAPTSRLYSFEKRGVIIQRETYS